jgi:hypothetical protein
MEDLTNARTDAKNARETIQRRRQIDRIWGNKSRREPTMKKRMLKITFEATMCMKTNKTWTFCRPKIATFLQGSTECIDILYRHSRILPESGAILSRIGRGQMRPSFQSAETQALDNSGD